MSTSNGAPDDWPQDVAWHKWPPFPTKPDGATIIPFSQFIATGLNPDYDEDNPSLDQMGVLTCELHVRHDGEKKKRRKKKKGPNGEITEIPLAWWEEMEEDDQSSRRIYSYDYNERYTERLIEAWKNFIEKRRFPTHVMTVCQSLGSFLGLADIQRHVNPNSKSAEADKSSDGDMSDEGEETDDDQQMQNDRELPESRVEEVQEEDLLKLDPEILRERAIDAFYNDPEKAIKIFLTSHAYDKGVYWNEGKLHDSPILVEVFLKFLEVNAVFGPTEESTKLRMGRAKKIAILAKDEMPHANKVARILPDSWGRACGEIWGQNVITGWVYGRLPETPEAHPANAIAAEQANPPVPALINDPIHGDGIIFEPTEEELLVDRVEPPNVNGEQTEWSTDAGGWGAANGWGPGSGGAGSWAPGGKGEGGGDPTWSPQQFADPPPEDPAVFWGNFGPSGRQQLEALIGPNKLPETYCTLRVESSSRVIGSLIEPVTTIPPGSEADSFASIAQQKLARLTLLPSPYSQKAPQIGACVNKPTMLNPEIDTEKFGWVAPHDPLVDNITLLVQSDEPVLEHLRAAVGMTVTGVFIQVAELIETNEEEVKDAKEDRVGEGEPPKKKKKKKGKKATTSDFRSWWFFYQMGQVYPTFFAE